MSETGGNGNTLYYRVAQLERELEKLENRWDTSFTDLRGQLGALLRDVAVLTNEYHSRHTELVKHVEQMEDSVTDDVKGLRKVLFSVGGAVLIAAITFAITSLAVFGAPG